MINIKNIVLGLIGVVLVVIIFYTFTQTGGEESFIQKVERERAEKINYLKNNADSPFKTQGGAPFKVPTYFEPDINFSIEASLTVNSIKEPFALATTSGQSDQYYIYGYADFTIDGQSQRLMLLEPQSHPDPDYLFLPFADGTSGNETYGGGRFLDLKKSRVPGVIEIDFNLAYNPYCAYNPNYVCPLPPAQNVLTVGVKAGEKIFK